MSIDKIQNELKNTLALVNQLNASVPGSAETIVREIQRISIEAISKTIQSRPKNKTTEDAIGILRNRVNDLCISEESARVANQEGIRDEKLIEIAKQLGISVFLNVLDHEEDRITKEKPKDSYPPQPEK